MVGWRGGNTSQGREQPSSHSQGLVLGIGPPHPPIGARVGRSSLLRLSPANYPRMIHHYSWSRFMAWHLALLSLSCQWPSLSVQEVIYTPASTLRHLNLKTGVGAEGGLWARRGNRKRAVYLTHGICRSLRRKDSRSAYLPEYIVHPDFLNSTLVSNIYVWISGSPCRKANSGPENFAHPSRYPWSILRRRWTKKTPGTVAQLAKRQSDK